MEEDGIAYNTTFVYFHHVTVPLTFLGQAKYKHGSVLILELLFLVPTDVQNSFITKITLK